MTEKEKIRVAVIGAGKMGTHHARALSKLPDVELVGVCDTNVWKAQLAAWQSNTVAVRDYKDVLSRVDAAIIAVGSELLTPERVDTNSLFITEVLNDLGIPVRFKAIVGDDREVVVLDTVSTDRTLTGR